MCVCVSVCRTECVSVCRTECICECVCVCVCVCTMLYLLSMHVTVFLKGLADVAENRDVLLAGAAVDVVPDEEDVQGSPVRRPKRWDLHLQRPDLDYSEIFAEDAGTLTGLTIWQIENFMPVEVEEGT